jgi:hypothetical protein
VKTSILRWDDDIVVGVSGYGVAEMFGGLRMKIGYWDR